MIKNSKPEKSNNNNLSQQNKTVSMFKMFQRVLIMNITLNDFRVLLESSSARRRRETTKKSRKNTKLFRRDLSKISLNLQKARKITLEQRETSFHDTKNQENFSFKEKKFIQMKFKWVCIMVLFCFLLTNTTGDVVRVDRRRKKQAKTKQNVI